MALGVPILKHFRVLLSHAVSKIVSRVAKRLNPDHTGGSTFAKCK